MLKINRVLAILLFLAISTSRADTPSAQSSDKVIKKDGWELHITYRAKGTRSEGRNGRLFFNSKEIIGQKQGELISTPLGEIKYFQDESKIEHLWDTSGWNFADSSKW